MHISGNFLNDDALRIVAQQQYLIQDMMNKNLVDGLKISNTTLNGKWEDFIND